MTQLPIEDVAAITQDDCLAAAELIEAYWLGDGERHDRMRRLAQDYRNGHTQGVWAWAFAKHRRASLNQIACPSGGEPDYNERLDYERRILAAECGTQRILNEFEAKLRRIAQQARSVSDALDPKAAEIIDNIATMVHDIDVTAPPDPAVGATAGRSLEQEARDHAMCEQIEAMFPGSVAWANDPSEFCHLIELTPERLQSVITAALARAGGSKVRRDALREALARISELEAVLRDYLFAEEIDDAGERQSELAVARQAAHSALSTTLRDGPSTGEAR